MIEAVLTGALGSWSAQAMVAAGPDAADLGPARMIDLDLDAGGPLGRAGAAFERALAAELQRAGDLNLNPLGAGFELQNGTVLSRAGEGQQGAGRIERQASEMVPSSTAFDQSIAPRAARRVDFGDDNAAAGLSTSRHDHLDQGAEVGFGPRFSSSERALGDGAFLAHYASWTDLPPADPIPGGRVFFNGDGRPIILPPAESETPGAAASDEVTGDAGDLMILPNGAVLAYDPWTVSAMG